MAGNIDLQVVLKDMRVLIRVDFNVPMKEMKVANNYKIKQTIPTLEVNLIISSLSLPFKIYSIVLKMEQNPSY